MEVRMTSAGAAYPDHRLTWTRLWLIDLDQNWLRLPIKQSKCPHRFTSGLTKGVL
jgi:hypothetical protein